MVHFLEEFQSILQLKGKPHVKTHLSCEFGAEFLKTVQCLEILNPNR